MRSPQARDYALPHPRRSKNAGLCANGNDSDAGSLRPCFDTYTHPLRARERTNLHVARVVCALPARASKYPQRRAVEELHAVERTCTKSLPSYASYAPFSLSFRALTSPRHPRHPFGTSLTSLYPSLCPPPSACQATHSSGVHLPSRRRVRGRLEGKRIYGGTMGRQGGGGPSGSRPGRHSRNDFVLRACLIMNPHPGEAPPPFARRTSSRPRGSSRGVGCKRCERVKRAR